MKEFPIQKFSLQAWLEGESSIPFDWNNGHEDLPERLDAYFPGHLTMGKDVDRGLAIQCGRLRKQRKTNLKFFEQRVLPLIESKLDPLSWKDIANHYDGAQQNEFMRRGGFVWYSLEDRGAWVHPKFEPQKVKRAEELGAKITEKNP